MNPPKKYYIRYGLWRTDERSEIGSRFRDTETFEKGVSVYHGEWDAVKNRWVISSEGFHSYLPTLDEHMARNRDQEEDVYLVTGDELDDIGTDGEPLLRNLKLIKQLSYSDVYNHDLYPVDAILDLEPAPALENAVTFLLKRPGSSAQLAEEALTNATIQRHLGGYFQMYHILRNNIVILVLELDYPEQNKDHNIFWPQVGVIFGPIIVTALASTQQILDNRKKLPWPWYQDIYPDPEEALVEGISIPGEEFRSLSEEEIASVSKILDKAGKICDSFKDEDGDDE